VPQKKTMGNLITGACPEINEKSRQTQKFARKDTGGKNLLWQKERQHRWANWEAGPGESQIQVELWREGDTGMNRPEKNARAKRDSGCEIRQKEKKRRIEVCLQKNGWVNALFRKKKRGWSIKGKTRAKH